MSKVGAPVFSATPPLGQVARPGATENFRPLVFNRLRTLFCDGNPQPSPFHAPTHSLAHGKRVTRAFPVACGLSPRSWTPERKSTPLLSSAYALFCKSGRGWGGAGRTLSETLGRPGRFKPGFQLFAHPSNRGLQCPQITHWLR